jgi:hypothetical protein
VALYPVGSSTPLFDVSFTSVSLTAPDASRFDFTAPKGATVTPFSGATNGTNTKGQPTQQSLNPQVLGTSWLSVVELHNVNMTQLQQAVSGAGSAVANSSSNSPNSNGGGTTVSGKFGSGKVYTTSVVSVLITNDGRVFLGAVTPQVLEADANAQGTK